MLGLTLLNLGKKLMKKTPFMEKSKMLCSNGKSILVQNEQNNFTMQTESFSSNYAESWSLAPSMPQVMN